MKVIPRIIPCLLLTKHGLYKTKGFKNRKYVGDIINAIKIFNDKGVDEIIILDIDATQNNYSIDFSAIQQMASECFVPLAYGGGVTDLSQVDKLIKLGIEKIVIGSAAHTKPQMISDIARVYGSQSVIVSIDVKQDLFGKYSVVYKSGNIRTSVSPLDFARQVVDLGAGELVLQNVTRDGTRKGYDIALIKQIADSIAVPVIALGGAGSIDDLRLGLQVGRASAVAAGSLFVFHGKHEAVLITYPSQQELLILQS